MQKEDKFFQLKALLQKYKSPNKNKASFQTQGEIIEILMQIIYFKSEAQLYGVEVLSCYIPLIETYMLRAGMQIIDSNEQYVIMEGVIKGTKNNGQPGNIYLDGMLIDPSLQLQKAVQFRQTLACIPERNTTLIKILRNSQDYKLLRLSQNLSKFQKQRVSKQRQMQRIIGLDKNLQINKQKLKKFQFYENISNYDLNELIINSKLILMKKGSVIYQFGDFVDRVAFLMTGQVKIDNSVLHNKDKPVEPGKLLLEKYMVHKKEHNSKVVNFVEPGQWIGLQEYLWGQPNFLSKAEIISHDAQVFLVQAEIFRKKFNDLTNFYKMNKLKGLVETKKKLLQKTIKTKKQREDQITRQKQKTDVLKRLQQRMQQTIVNDQVQKKKQLLIKTNKSEEHVAKKKKLSQLKVPKQCYMPDRLVHKVKVYEQKYESLPKISQRFTLFPEEYQKAMVPLQLRHQLKMMKQARNPVVSKGKPFKVLSNEKIYQTVIYASLSPRQINPQALKTSRKITKIKSKASIQFQQSFDIKNQLFQTFAISNTSKFRFNESIFNNFRAPKNKGQKLLQNISKTLQII